MRDERVRVVVVLLEVWMVWGCGGLWARNVVVGWKMGCWVLKENQLNISEMRAFVCNKGVTIVRFCWLVLLLITFRCFSGFCCVKKVFFVDETFWVVKKRLFRGCKTLRLVWGGLCTKALYFGQYLRVKQEILVQKKCTPQELHQLLQKMRGRIRCVNLLFFFHYDCFYPT